MPLGLVAGYAGGVVDNVIMRPLEILMAFPAILLAITVMAIFGTGVGVLMLAIGVVYVPIIARVMRASTLATRRELFVEAARARGASRWRIVLRHVLPNSVGPGDRAGVDPAGDRDPARGRAELHRARRPAADAVARR